MSFFPDESILIIKPDEDEHPIWRLYSNKSVNVCGNGVGTILISLKGDHYSVAIQFYLLEQIIWPSMKYAIGL